MGYDPTNESYKEITYTVWKINVKTTPFLDKLISYGTRHIIEEEHMGGRHLEKNTW